MRSPQSVFSAPLLCSFATLSLISATPAQTSTQELVAWARVEVNGTTSPFTPSLAYQYTSTGETVTVERIAAGSFLVKMGSITNAGVAHVTPYGANHSAVIDYWGPNSGQLAVRVNLFDETSAPVDASFCIHYRAGGASDSRSAYLWASNPTSTTPYQPSSTYAFNGNRSAPQITRVATGRYEVLLPGLSHAGAQEGGHVQVSAYGGPVPIRAKIESWGNSGNDLRIWVRTFNVLGTPSDEYFTLSYHEEAAPIAPLEGSGSHVWANDPSGTLTYTPNGFYTDSNGNEGPANAETITKIATGVYNVQLPNVIPSGSSIAMATAYGYGLSAEFATVASWGPGASSGTEVQVRTYSSAGVPTDSRFTLLYLTDDPAAAPATATTYGVGCGQVALDFTPDPTAPPVAGSTARATITNPPSLVGGVALGLSNTFWNGVPLPVDLTAIGMPGCDLLTSTDSVGLPVITSGNMLDFEYGIPSNAVLIGFHIYAQAYALAPGQNALGGIASNGIDWEIGSF